MVPGERALRGADGRLRARSWSRPPRPPAPSSCNGRAAPPIRSPRRSGSPSPTRSTSSPASTCWRRSTAGEPRPRRARRRGAARPASRSPTTTPGPTSSAASWSSGSSRVSASAGRRCSTNIRCRRRRWRGRSRRSAARRALRALCLRRRARQRLRRAHRRGRAAPPLRGGDGGEGSAATASAIRSTRISSRRSAAMPPASGIALGFDRLVMLATGAAAHRAGAVDAGRRATIANASH